MIRKGIKKLCVAGMICVMILGNTEYLAAKEMPTYKGYTYDGSGKVVPAPNVYTVVDILDGYQLGEAALNKPEDLYITPEDRVYILDSGNSRVVLLNPDLEVEKIIDKITKNGEESPLKEPKGIFVNEQDEIVIADKGNGRVVVMDESGKILEELIRPETELIPSTTIYEPIKAIQDNQGNTYVVSKNFYQGMIIYDKQGVFNGFFGANKVKGNLQIVSDYFYRKLMTKEQKELMAKYVPTEIMSVEMDKDGYLYTTCYASESEEVIKRLNPYGNNTLVLDKTTSHQLSKTKFTDVTLTDKQYIYALDIEMGKVFEFDPYGLNITTFGGIGDQNGLFKEPVAVEYKDNQIYVLDRLKGNITVFELSEYGTVLHKAIDLYNKGLYEEAIKPWKEVLKLNANYNLAYIGLGDAYMSMGEYKTAMDYYMQAHDREGYNDAFREYRVAVIREHFNLVIAGVIVILVITGILKIKKSSYFQNKKLVPRNR